MSRDLVAALALAHAEPGLGAKLGVFALAREDMACVFGRDRGAPGVVR